MSIGNRIKQRRMELGLTADDLANRINKSRATVYRYENGDIENMPTTVLEPLAKALNTTPADLMGWGANQNKEDSGDIQLQFINHIINQGINASSILSTDETHLNRLRGLIMHFEQLNISGQLEAIKRVEELTYVNKYIHKKAVQTSNKYAFYSRSLSLDAAHARTDIEIPEDADLSEDDIMDSEDF